METNQLFNLSPSQLRRAAELKERIDGLNDELAMLLGGEIGNARASESADAESHGKTAKRGMSAAGRARIGAAAKARWARIRAAKGQSGTSSNREIASAPKAQRTMSPAAKKKIAAAARARWAKVRASKGQS